MKKYHLIIILTAIFFNFGVAIAENRREVNIANELHSGIKFHLIVRNSPFNRSSNKLKRLWGDFGGNDNEVISKMLFELNGQKVLIPNLAYGDLLNVELNAIQVTEINENISISIKGGDGAGAYESRIVIEKMRPAFRETGNGSLGDPRKKETINFSQQLPKKPK